MPIYVPGKVVLAKEFTWNETVWNPSMIATALWLDAADAGTVTTVGGAVSQWNDKSGNSRNAVEVAGISKPTLATAVQNNLNTIRFNGTQAFSVPNAVSITRNIGSFSVIAIRKFAVLPATEQNIFRANTNGGGSRVFFGAGVTTTNKAQVGGRRLDADSFASVTSSGDASTTLFEIQSGIYDYANSDLYLHINGTLIASSTSFQTDGTTSGTDSQIVAIGGGGGSPPFQSGFFNGDIGELVALPTAASLDTRQRIEGYLAHKWGLTANLPSDHPYKTVGPTP
jgi:hypothetical protein